MAHLAMLSMSQTSCNVTSVIASQYPVKQRSSPITRFNQFCGNHPKQNPPFSASDVYANERWVNTFISRSGAAVNCQGWLGYPEPSQLFVQCCRTWIFWGGETDGIRAHGTAEWAFLCPLHQQCSQLCLCILHLFPFQSFQEPGMEINRICICSA